MLAIQLPTEIEDRLDALAKATGRTKSFYAKEAILEYLDDLEDFHSTMEVLERIRRGEESTYSLEEVEKQFDLAD